MRVGQGTQAMATFSADTDTASYSNIRQMLRAGQRPHPEDIRIEEMINYFDYGFAPPTAKQPFSVSMELASSPWSPGNKILRVGLQARKISNEERAQLMGHSLHRIRGREVYGDETDLRIRALYAEMIAFPTESWSPRPYSELSRLIDAILDEEGFKRPE